MSSHHWEAVRRQRVFDKREEAQRRTEEQKKELAEKNRREQEELAKGSQSASYHRQMLDSRGQGQCNHPTLDEQRRLEHQEVLKEHFLRSRLRYNDTDCAQQW
ncbi:outer spore wall assembly protein SHE10-like [Strongylocentrotus purpuratus]|uniref:Uncharacterized protein n=1 Tax=Strongylocentrotus purpuratus TaxID=7668 RepID=A0A7M7G0B4_STRPU|nr:outer spore wall assembly protein SHE10-like [Strongylocentrotus purpuratus]|eukprot:XP_001175653.1 PREDICTED: outer spore wall assembly protein SHE10-like [Strongylocentrotus purpuratus]